MIGYATLGTNNIEAARNFYDGLLGTIGAKRAMQMDEHGGFTFYAVSMDKPGIVVTEPLTEALVTPSGKPVYPVRVGVPVLLDEQAMPLAQVEGP